MRIVSLTREQWLFCLQLGLAMMVAYFVTHGNDPANAIYAVLGAGLATAPSVGEGLGISKERIVGTLLGALVSLTAMWLHDRALALGAMVVIIGPFGMMLGGIAVARIAVTVAAVTVMLHTESVDVYGVLRFTNTVAGVAVALAVAFLLWPFSRHAAFSLTLRSTLAAAALLADQLAKGEVTAFPLDGQRKLFMALSSLPKSLTHAQLDPLLYRQRDLLRDEALLVAKIGIALLATSLALRRSHADLLEKEHAALQACYRHIGDRLHRIRHPFDSQPAVAPTASEPALPLGGGVPTPFARLAEELRAIKDWIDELDTLLGSNSATSFVPNRLRAKSG